MIGTRRAPGQPRLSAATERRRPVLLATLGVPLVAEAASFAVDAAVESGQPLLVANVVELPPLAMSVTLGYDQLDDGPTAASLRAPAELARSLGVEVERVRVRSLRPVDALLELAHERRPSVLVFGAARRSLRPHLHRKVVKALRAEASFLVWIAD